ncbi:MAG: PilN domain-containing protein [Wenzhouxiangella sp.]
MNQQINLYQPIFRKPKIIFSAQTILAVGAGFILLLLAWTALVSQRVGALENQLESQRAAEQQVLAQIEQLRRDQPEPADLSTLEEAIDDLNRRRLELRQSLAALEETRPVAQSRLHERYDALARQRPDGLWLTELRLDERTSDIAIQGRALAARLVPLYLQNLSAEPVIQGATFSQIRLEEANKGNPGVRFSINTRPGEE